MIAGLAAMLAVWGLTPTAFTWYVFIGATTTVGTAWSWSRLAPSRRMNAPGLEAVADLLCRRGDGARVAGGRRATPARRSARAGRSPPDDVTYAAGAALVTPATVYDLASLTKVVATTALAMRHACTGALPLDTAVADRLPSCIPLGRITVADLLSTRPACPLIARSTARWRAARAISRGIAAEPQTYAPRATARLQRSRLHAARPAHRAGRWRPPGGAVRSVRAQRRWAAPEIGYARARRVACSRRADERRRPGASGCSWATCTTTTPRPRRRGRSRRALRHGARLSARSPAGSCRCGRAASSCRPESPPPRPRASPPAARCRAVRARWAGTRCCRRRRAARACRRAPSATPASPARRSGSIPTRDLYVVLLTNRVHPRSEGEGAADGIKALRVAVHDVARRTPTRSSASGDLRGGAPKIGGAVVAPGSGG